MKFFWKPISFYLQECPLKKKTLVPCILSSVMKVIYFTLIFLRYRNAFHLVVVLPVMSVVVIMLFTKRNVKSIHIFFIAEIALLSLIPTTIPTKRYKNNLPTPRYEILLYVV